MTENYVYGDLDGDLIFVRRELADQLAAVHTGFETWGDAKAGLDANTWSDLRARFVDSEEEVPGAEEQFDLDAVPGFADGDWPVWPAALMVDEVPETVREQFGSVEDSVLNGPFLKLQATGERKLVSALESRGWVCTRDDELIRRATGH
ncbi:MAG: hypothetical protein WBA00_13455 [Rhodococcus sp. (in: high G+C Gram-positive bacteria)]